MERLSTLYNADVGLYMLANKVRLLSSFTCRVLDVFFFFTFILLLSGYFVGEGFGMCFGFWIEFLREIIRIWEAMTLNGLLLQHVVFQLCIIPWAYCGCTVKLSRRDYILMYHSCFIIGSYCGFVCLISCLPSVDNSAILMIHITIFYTKKNYAKKLYGLEWRKLNHKSITI